MEGGSKECISVTAKALERFTPSFQLIFVMVRKLDLVVELFQAHLRRPLLSHLLTCRSSSLEVLNLTVKDFLTVS